MATKKKEKTTVRKRTWNITLEDFSDGTSAMHRSNDGFLSFELLGLCEMMKADVLKQIVGEIKPDEIKREVIVP